MNTHTHYIICLSLAVAAHIAGYSDLAAQSAKHSLQECIDIALKNNLAVKAGTLAVEKARDMQGTAFDIDKTDISLSQDPTAGGSPDNSLSLTQSLDFPTVYASRHKYLKAETELERSNLAVVRNDLIKDVTCNYYSLLHIRKRIKILFQQDSICSRFLNIAQIKRKEGDASRLEEINARRLYDENRLALQKEQNTESEVLLNLRRLLNSDTQVEPVESELPIMSEPAADISANFAQTPWGSVYENQKNVSERSLKLAKQGYMPSLSFTLRNQLVVKGFNPYDIKRERFEKGNFMGFEVGLGIPLFFGATRAKAKAARNEIKIAEVRQRDGEKALLQEYAARTNEYRRAKNALAYYKISGAVAADEIARLSQLSYEKGEIGYLEYIQNIRSALEINLKYADAINEYNQSVIMLNYLQGFK